MPLISVLVPVYNESHRIAKTIMALKNTIPEPRQIIVVDDGSVDNTFAIVNKLNVEVYKLKKNVGKGEALNKIVPFVKGDYILLVDGDLEDSAKEVEKLLIPVLEGRTDVAIAKFPDSHIKGFGLVKGLAKIGVKLCSGKTYSCILSGQRAMTREVFNAITPFAHGYSIEVASTIKIARLGVKVSEIPVNMTHRTSGKNVRGFYHRGKQFWHIFNYFLHKEFIHCILMR
jgi:glycosyltransferase involved in cell wall biosynthesis